MDIRLHRAGVPSFEAEMNAFIQLRKEPGMNKLMAGLCCLLLATAPVMAQDKGKTDEKAKAPSEAQQKQQERMKACNAKAADKNLKGDERKTFMSACLKGDDGLSAKQEAQQNRMKDCNKQAGDKKMKGDERKSFMSACLKG
jgi:hypothetical protein